MRSDPEFPVGQDQFHDQRSTQRSRSCCINPDHCGCADAYATSALCCCRFRFLRTFSIFAGEFGRDTTDKQAEPKGKCHVKNWAQYNAGLIAPGDVTMWIDPDVLAAAPELEVRTRGRPCVYADALVQMLLELKQVFHLPLRALQGFAESRRKLAFPRLPVPNLTTLSRRAQTLKVALPSQHPKHHLVLDDTGLKVYGEGKRKVRQRCWSKRRTWRKVHLAIGTKIGQNCDALVMDQDHGDGEVLTDLLDQSPADVAIDAIGSDGAYDSEACHARIAARGAAPSIPPPEGAARWPENTRAASLQCRCRRDSTTQHSRDRFPGNRSIGSCGVLTAWQHSPARSCPHCPLKTSGSLRLYVRSMQQRHAFLGRSRGLCTSLVVSGAVQRGLEYIQAICSRRAIRITNSISRHIRSCTPLFLLLSGLHVEPSLNKGGRHFVVSGHLSIAPN